MSSGVGSQARSKARKHDHALLRGVKAKKRRAILFDLQARKLDRGEGVQRERERV